MARVSGEEIGQLAGVDLLLARLATRQQFLDPRPELAARSTTKSIASRVRIVLEPRSQMFPITAQPGGRSSFGCVLKADSRVRPRPDPRREPDAPLLQRNKRIDLGLRTRQELISTMRLILAEQALPGPAAVHQPRPAGAACGTSSPLHGLYPAGRLDYDSEGLMLLTDFGPWQARISQPGSPFPKVYLAQVEGVAGRGGARAPATRRGARTTAPPCPPPRGSSTEPGWLWPRDPPIRVRKAIPTAWIELELREGGTARCGA